MKDIVACQDHNRDKTLTEKNAKSNSETTIKEDEKEPLDPGF